MLLYYLGLVGTLTTDVQLVTKLLSNSFRDVLCIFCIYCIYIDKLGMDIFSKLEPVFGSELSNFFHNNMCQISGQLFFPNFFFISSSLIEICRVKKNPLGLPVGFF